MNKILKTLKGQGDNYILPFFWQHGETEEVLRDYMRAISEANIGAVCVESRPHPDYVGDKWWQDMDVILDEARKRDMKVWILDDSHFPTGFANGAMKDQPLSLARRSVTCKKTAFAGGQLTLTTEELKHPDEPQPTEMEKRIAMMMGGAQEQPAQTTFEDDALVSIVAISKEGDRVDLFTEINEKGLDVNLPEADWSIYQINTTRNRGPHKEYINMIDFDSVRVLIDTVYESHWAHYKDDFGKTIAGFFSDEPELGNGHMYDLHNEMGKGFDMDYPWSDELAERLTEAYGAEIGFMMPLIWETEGDADATAQARYIYMDNMTELVKKNFSYQLGDWCREHGVKYIGHVVEDNGQHARTGSTLGHYFRGLAGEDMAGIDDIGGQVYPNGEDDNYELGLFQVRNGNFYHFLLGKLANSAAGIEPLKHGDAMCEIFGNYGWEEGTILEKYLADHFLCRGINHFVPHAFTPMAFPDPDCPPHFYAHGNNPQYRAFGYLMKYMNNVAEQITDGVHVSPIAVIYHGEAEWSGKYMPNEEVTRKLTEAQLDFDIIPQDVFLDKEGFKTRIADGELVVNTQHYRAVVVPTSQFVTAEFAEDVKKLAAAGIRVYFIGEYPEGICNRGKQVNGRKLSKADEAALIEEIKTSARVAALKDITAKLEADGLADIKLSTPDTYVHYYHYVQADGTEVYMIINEGNAVYEGQIDFKGLSDGHILSIDGAIIYDAYDNVTRAPKITDGKLQVSIVPSKSLIVVFASRDVIAELKAYEKEDIYDVIAASEKTAFANGTWKRSLCESIKYPAFENIEEVSMPDKCHEDHPEFAGYVRYENSFEAEAGKQYVLKIGEAWEAVEVFVNGASLGYQIVPDYVFDMTSLVKPGVNDVAIEVASTLERTMNIGPDVFGRPREIKGKLGITGLVELYVK